MFRKSCIALAAVLLFSPLGVAAISFERQLTPRQAAELPADARAAYDEALEFADRIDYRAAIASLGRAAELAPDNIDLQLLLLRYARRMAELEYGEQALRYFGMAESAVGRLLATPALGPEERARVGRESEAIRRGRETIREREEARFETGARLMGTINRDRMEAAGIERQQSLARQIKTGQGPDETEAGSNLKTPADIWPEKGAPGFDITQNWRWIIAGQTPANAAMGGFGGEFGGAPMGGFGGPPVGGFGQPAPGGGFGAPPGGGFGAPAPQNPFGGAPVGGAPTGNPFGGAPVGGAPGGNPFGGAPAGGAPGGNPFGGAPAGGAPGGNPFGGGAPTR